MPRILASCRSATLVARLGFRVQCSLFRVLLLLEKKSKTFSSLHMEKRSPQKIYKVRKL